MSSSGAAITPMRVPTGTVSPSWTTILRRTPDPNASTSMFALSVSISATTSPWATGSPSRTFHSISRPSSIVGLSCAITTLVAKIPPQSCGPFR